MGWLNNLLKCKKRKKSCGDNILGCNCGDLGEEPLKLF